MTDFMLDPSDLQPSDLEDDKLIECAVGYLRHGSAEDLCEMFQTIRDMGYHVGYEHGLRDLEPSRKKKDPCGAVVDMSLVLEKTDMVMADIEDVCLPSHALVYQRTEQMTDSMLDPSEMENEDNV